MLEICPSDAASQATLVENDGLVAHRGRVSENSPIRQARTDVSARPPAFGAGRNEAPTSRGAHRDATKIPPRPEGSPDRAGPGPPCAEADPRRMILEARVSRRRPGPWGAGARSVV